MKTPNTPVLAVLVVLIQQFKFWCMAAPTNSDTVAQTLKAQSKNESNAMPSDVRHKITFKTADKDTKAAARA